MPKDVVAVLAVPDSSTPASSASVGASAATVVSAPAVAAVTSSAPVEAPAPAAPALTPEPAAPAPQHDFKPSLLEVEGAPSPAAPVAPQPEAAKPEPVVADVKPAEPAKPAEVPIPEPVVPIVYEFRYPENVDQLAIDKPVVEKYTGILSKARVPVEVAQELMDLHLDQVKQIAPRLAENQWEVFNRQQESWQNQVKGDPELGGSRIRTVMRIAASFIEQFGGSPAQQKAIMDVMRTTGAGNHPEVLRLFYRAGEFLAREGQARNIPPARQLPLTREQKQAARYKTS